ncbi:conjugative transposon protein TraM [Flavobacterium chilense]|uniref:Bacteroides conjugative transposon TraM protein n=1 Tax=Flavobacterium chilense TaxID=946677 RepID=A0A1M7MHF3_9FLAO|nr:conjugative transposon protein TraM [Flavobacterium chilense]SHM90233.1 Bacteroides conjugative transposon TraM protein [Flavobacterium chilense]
MKENENKKSVVRVTEGNPSATVDVVQDSTQNKMEKLKKPLIFGLMGVVFLGCMYLIFKPNSDKKEIENIGLNDVVPQASEADLQSDKQKAYEEEILEEKNQEKRNALTSLSDYWNTDEKEQSNEALSEEEDESNTYGRNSQRSNNPALNSYRNAQNTLEGFYQEDNYETQQLRKQMEELKEQLAEKEAVAPDPVKTQLQLMEKSYEMASKYLPSGGNTGKLASNDSDERGSSSNSQKEYFVAFTPTRKKAVSALYREQTDSIFLADWSEYKNRGFYTAGSEEQVAQPKNSVKASIQETQTIIGESGVRLRLLEPAQTPNRTIPKGTILTAIGKFQGGRLQLKVTSIELEGNIIPVDITIYDLDGQQGLYVPYSPERNAVTDIVANMGNATGSSFSMNSSTGQQIGSDLSKSAVQGISGYFAKKIRTPKITLKAGHQVFLVSKK